MFPTLWREEKKKYWPYLTLLVMTTGGRCSRRGVQWHSWIECGEHAVLALLRKCGCLRQQKEGQAPVRLHLWRPDMQYHATAAAAAAALVPLLWQLRNSGSGRMVMSPTMQAACIQLRNHLLPVVSQQLRWPSTLWPSKYRMNCDNHPSAYQEDTMFYSLRFL